MSWLYVQRTGELFHEGQLQGCGYAGNRAGRNNPAMQAVPDIGPLPCGVYRIGDISHEPRHAHLGPLALPLTPDPANEMYGREGFLIHAEALPPTPPGFASLGCMVFNRATRELIDQSIHEDPANRRLEVIAERPIRTL